MLSENTLNEFAIRGLLKEARQKLALGENDEAINLIEKAHCAKPCAESYHLRGLALAALGKDEEAAGSIEQAVMLDPNLDQAYADLAHIVARNNYFDEALECWALAIKTNPHSLSHKHEFLALASQRKLARPNPALKALVLECLEEKNLDLSVGSGIWHQIVKTDPAMRAAYQHNNKKDYNLFKKGILKGACLKPLLDPFFLKGLENITVCEPQWEEFLTRIRRILLEERKDDRPAGLTQEGFTTLAAALAKYCFYTEYVFFVDKDEQELVEALLKSVENTKAPVPADLAILACYKPLFSLESSSQISASSQSFTDSPVQAVIELQINDHLAQQEIREGLPKITDIKDAVSVAVQEQYEDFPYPRWRAYKSEIYNRDMEGYLEGKAAEILVAGCGTGREAIELAAAFPDARILAIDLSSASLAYGAYAAQRHKINNVEFQQGDILHLPALKKKFDYIASSGVLHHMKEPMRGWEILFGCLKPGGAMRIGLYSSIAREAINEGRQAVKDNGFGVDDQSIRRFRHELTALVNKGTADNIRGYHDWYFLSECRDLLFHVQEHQFTLHEISGALDKLGLVFGDFHLGQSVKARYQRQYPDDPTSQNLLNWAEFEGKNPATFREMYRFWCIKPI